MTDGVIATISGTMLTPGLSRNKRLYIPELIEKTVKRMQTRIADPNGLPIVMRSHHAAEDDSTRIAGLVTSVTTDESGSARYRADIYDTAAGRDIAALITPNKPALRSTSIHGYWLGPVKQIKHDGVTAEVAPDLEVDKIDFTATPGVPGAVIDICTRNPQESMVQRTPISESYEARVETPSVEEKGAPPLASGKAAVAPTPGASRYADPGYQGDKAPRYPIDTKAHVRSALSYLAKKSNAAKYTPKQLARVMGRIKAAAKKFGIDVDENYWVDSGEVSELYDAMATTPGSFCVRLCNGPIEVTVTSYSVDPADLDLVGRAAMDGACQALAVMDPDWDADIDITSEPDRGDMSGDETAPTEPIETSPTNPVEGTTTSTEQEPTVSEATTQAADTTATPARTLTDADVRAIGETVGATVGAAFATALKEHIPAPVTATQPTTIPSGSYVVPVTATALATESIPKVAEGPTVNEAVITALKETITTLREDLAKSVTTAVATETQRVRDELREELQRAGIAPGRRGYRVHENTPTSADETPEKAFEDRARILLGDFALTPTPIAGTGTAPEPVGATR